jgi:hypothetical protein
MYKKNNFPIGGLKVSYFGYYELMYFSIKWDEVSLLSTDNLTHLFDGLIYTQQRPPLMANYCVCTKNGIQQNLHWGNMKPLNV